MNIAMEQTEEYVNGQLKAKYGDCFIRGNNGEALFPIAIVRCYFSQRNFLFLFFLPLAVVLVLYISASKRRA